MPSHRVTRSPLRVRLLAVIQVFLLLASLGVPVAALGVDPSPTPDPIATSAPTDSPAPAATDSPAPAPTDTPAPAATDSPIPAATDSPAPTDAPTSPPPNPPATVTTDASDYPPGSVVTISGTGWDPGSMVILKLVRQPSFATELVWDVFADANGNFIDTSYSTTWDDAGASFVITAASGSGDYAVSASFTDAVSDCYRTVTSGNPHHRHPDAPRHLDTHAGLRVHRDQRPHV